jgi:hypothetical protein
MSLNETVKRASEIPVGLGTKIGVYSGVAGILLALFLEATGTNLDPDTLKALGGGWGALLLTAAGRFAQAYAKYRDAPGIESGLVDEDDELPADTDESVSPPALGGADITGTGPKPIT